MLNGYPQKILRETLEDLRDADLQKFSAELLERRDGVKTNQVEGKGFLEIAAVMVSVYSEKRVLQVADEILRGIRCVDMAEKLAEAAKTGGFPYQGGAFGGAVQFVDNYMDQLIQRVTSTSPILDKLFRAKIIQEETYDQISALPTSQAKMRALYQGPFKGGKRCKAVFYEILKELEPFLVEDLMDQ